MSGETPDPRPARASRPRGTNPQLERRAGVLMYGALPVIGRHLHDQWCSGEWPMTRFATARDLAICPGCGCAVRVGPDTGPPPTGG